LYRVRDVGMFKRHLRERLSSGWLIVTGDPVCTIARVVGRLLKEAKRVASQRAKAAKQVQTTV